MRYFHVEEFECGCGRCNKGFDDMDQALLVMLDDARARAGTPFVLTSAVRCQAHNAAVGGATRSAHLTGNAVDIAVGNNMARGVILRALVEAGFRRIGVARGFLHVDNAAHLPSPRTWLY